MNKGRIFDSKRSEVVVCALDAQARKIVKTAALIRLFENVLARAVNILIVSHFRAVGPISTIFAGCSPLFHPVRL